MEKRISSIVACFIFIASFTSFITAAKVRGQNSDMVFIPAGEFTMGSTYRSEEQPVHKVDLDAYYIDKYEVTNKKYAVYLNEAIAAGKIQISGNKVYQDGQILIDLTGYNSANNQCHINYNGGTFTVDSGWENHPVVFVSWYGANAYAQHFGLKLPTEAQWEKAAHGTDGRTYPWGEATPTHNHLNYMDRVNTTTTVGNYSPLGDSPYGVCDIEGNVHEWCADWYDANYYSNGGPPWKNPEGPSSGTERVVRSASFSDDANWVVRCAFRGWPNHPSNCWNHFGFRCIRLDSETGTGHINHEKIPGDFYLSQNFPNPFNPETKIEYRVHKAGEFILQIYNQLGQKVRTLVKETKPAGEYTVMWDGNDDYGYQVASGIYFYQLKLGDEALSKKMIKLQ